MRQTARWCLLATFLAGLCTVASGAGPCCGIKGIDQRSGVVTAVDSASGRTFQFRVEDLKLLGSLRVGQKVYANFRTNQVSLDSKTACCSILSGPTGSGERMPESESQKPSVKPTIASTGGQQPQPTPIKPIEDTTDGAIRGSTAATTPASAPATEACCAITALEAGSATVSARATATGQVFAFVVADRQLFDSLKVGQSVYANFKTGQASLNGKSACCWIGDIPAPSAGLGIHPASVHFGIVNFGQTVSGDITLTNTGQKKETVEVPPEQAGSGTFGITSGAGIFSLEPGQSHGVTVSCQCGGNATFLEGRRTIEYRGDPGTPPGYQQISFDAKCVPRPSQVSVNPAALDFGAVKIGTSASKSFTVRNPGSVPAHCTVHNFGVQQEFVITSTLGFAVSPGASQTVTVKFTPGTQPKSYGPITLEVHDVGETGTASHLTWVALSGSGKS